jgi:hypothetical protein
MGTIASATRKNQRDCMLQQRSGAWRGAADGCLRRIWASGAPEKRTASRRSVRWEGTREARSAIARFAPLAVADHADDADRAEAANSAGKKRKRRREGHRRRHSQIVQLEFRVRVGVGGASAQARRAKRSESHFGDIQPIEGNQNRPSRVGKDSSRIGKLTVELTKLNGVADDMLAPRPLTSKATFGVLTTPLA